MRRTWPTSSFESPCAISSITSRCRGVIVEGSRSACMRATVPRVGGDRHSPKGVFSRLAGAPALRGAGGDLPGEERRLMTARVRGARLILVEGTDPEQQLELVAQVRPHH